MAVIGRIACRLSIVDSTITSTVNQALARMVERIQLCISIVNSKTIIQNPSNAQEMFNFDGLRSAIWIKRRSVVFMVLFRI